MTVGLLANLLLDRAAASTVAIRGKQAIDIAQFRADVGAALARVEALSCHRGLVVCDDAYWAMVGMFALAHAGAETLFPANALPSTLGKLAGTYDHILTDGVVTGGGTVLLNGSVGTHATIEPMNADEARVTLFTSGSSGTPKRVVKTVRQLELEAEIVERLLGSSVPHAARIHSTVVHHHLYGLTFRLCWPLATRRPFHCDAHKFWEPLLAVVRSDDVVVTTPSHLARLGGLPSLPAGRHQSVVLSGGAPLPDDAVQSAYAVFGCPVREFMGSTEAGVIGSRLRTGDSLPFWRPLPGLSVTRLDDGRMHVRSPYILNPDDELSDDLIELNDEGEFRLLGRADRLAKIEGVRISLAEFDAQITELAGVAQAAAVVLGGEISYLGGVVVLDADGEKELATVGAFRLGRRLRQELSTRFPAATLPRRWRFVRQLPLTALGKISAPDLTALFTSSDAEASSFSSIVEPHVTACVPTTDGVELKLQITPDLAALEGHFPGLPIVPGVCLIDWAARFAGRYLEFSPEGPPRLQVKFRRVLQPGCNVTLTLRKLVGGRIGFDYRHLDIVYSSGTISANDA